VEKADLILKADYVLTMEQGAGEKETGLMEAGACAVKGGLITDVGHATRIEKEYSAQTVLGGERYVLIPGLINTHTHAPMVFLRGIADDLPLREWLERHIWPLEQKWLGPEFIYDATRLACLEMTKAGITTYNDMYFYEREAAGAIKEMSMRAVLGSGILDFPTKVARSRDEYFERAEKNIKFFLDTGGPLIKPSIAPHAIYTCGPECQKEAARMAREYGILMHLHLSETKWESEEITKLYGMKPVKFLKHLGVLSERVLAAHCVWVDDEEIKILAESGAGVAHCVESNLKLASGIAPVPRMLEAGVRVTFGTDGAASNNDLNLFGEMATAAKLHKAASGDPTALDAKTTLKMATIWGAEALGLGKETGSIRKGKAADLVLININKPHLTPVYNVFSQLVYAAGRQDVDSVIVNGKLLLKNGKLMSGNEAEILNKAREWGEKIKASI
jgi:5-methylthioadenosine/S-adenosylhomocysteine deaminase